MVTTPSQGARRARTPSVLAVWMNGQRVGEWELRNGEHRFRYAGEWIASPAARRLSLSLPFTPGNAVHRGEVVRNYFDNLLPDSDVIRQRLRDRFATPGTGAFDLLAAIGRDCVGAVQLLPPDASPVGFDRIEAEPLDEAGVERAIDATLSPGRARRRRRPARQHRCRLAGRAGGRPGAVAAGLSGARCPHHFRRHENRCETPGHLSDPMKQDAIEPFFATLRAANPAPTTELVYGTPFELLVAVVLSAQATDVSVNKATRTLFPLASTPRALLELGVERLEGHIKAIGLYRGKAKNLVETARLLLERHGGEVPRTRAELEALPGVGRKTANVVLNTAFGEAVMAVDTHILRVCNRTGLAPGKTPLAVELGLEARVPPEFRRYAHHWLLLHGRYVCVARTPRCWQCAVAAYCDYPSKTPAPQGGRAGG